MHKLDSGQLRGNPRRGQAPDHLPAAQSPVQTTETGRGEPQQAMTAGGWAEQVLQPKGDPGKTL